MMSSFSFQVRTCSIIILFQVTHFHHSASATRELLSHQKSQGVSRPLNLIQEVVTRWNSQLAMMKRLLKLRVSLFTVLHNEEVVKKADRKKLELSDVTWKVKKIKNLIN